MRIHSTETFLENFIQKIWYSGKYFVYLYLNYKTMNLQQIAKKYGINDSYLNSKDDALLVAASSLADVQAMVMGNQPREQIKNRIQYVIDFMSEVKNSSL